MRSAILFPAVLAACASRPPASARPEPWQMTGALEHAMMNCPSAIVGATTRVRPTRDGVEIAITSGSPVAREQIRELAEYHAALGDPLSDRSEHSGFHGGPGKVGHCPIIHDRTEVTYRPLPDGAALHVRPFEPARVEAVQRETAQRAAHLPRWLPH